MSAALFRQGYPGLQAFLPFRDAGLSSAMSPPAAGLTAPS